MIMRNCVLFLPVVVVYCITVAPPVITELSGGEGVAEGASFTLTCFAGGWPTPRIQVHVHVDTLASCVDVCHVHVCTHTTGSICVCTHTHTHTHAKWKISCCR